jgi:hypothetical protein
MIHGVLCFIVAMGTSSMPNGRNFWIDFAQYRLSCLKSISQLSLTEGKVLGNMLCFAGNLVITHQLGFHADWHSFLSPWFKRAKAGDRVRGFPPGFTTHQRLPLFIDRQQLLGGLAELFIRKRNDRWPVRPTSLIDEAVYIPDLYKDLRTFVCLFELLLYHDLCNMT